LVHQLPHKVALFVVRVSCPRGDADIARIVTVKRPHLWVARGKTSNFVELHLWELDFSMILWKRQFEHLGAQFAIEDDLVDLVATDTVLFCLAAIINELV
jgi:hypothetical protein